MRGAAALVTVAGAIAACGAGAPTPPSIASGPTLTAAGVAPGAPLFFPGETMIWAISVAGVGAGEATLIVGEPGLIGGRDVIAVRSLTESAGALRLLKVVRDDVTTWIDLGSAQPTAMHADMRFGDRHVYVESTFHGNVVDIRHRREGKDPHDSHMILPLGDVAFDAHAALGAIRAWEPVVGEQRTLFVFGGRRLWRTVIELRGRENIVTAVGSRSALRLEGVATPLKANLEAEPKRPQRQFTVWLSDDADRVPLLLKAYTELGDVEMALTDYQSPTTVAAR